MRVPRIQIGARRANLERIEGMHGDLELDAFQPSLAGVLGDELAKGRADWLEEARRTLRSSPCESTFFELVRPELQKLLVAASVARVVRPDVDTDLLTAVASLCHSSHHSSPEHASRMLGVH